MDKKKVKVHVENVSKILGTKRQTLSAGNLEHLQNELKLALIELSKSDWVSVEDKQPPKNVVVQVCNKQEPDDLILAYRTNHGTMKIVYPGNVAICRITHWKPIEKLDKIK